ncbi:uncharacterized protein I206_105217 [Kwoniella pini CBS 10737]|uniref:Prefoldin, alpha subunit n=1 Tax=Kwoniella pini CBS 10737 TaxID=1296096 RepID=A0A1B9I4U8_9TREE|nr:uncharacterized protein I206_03874 [Kwoniella pini CBS 10737]OCF50549.1 hypothetical protein I206_03874 [Kwoniella pini CBS 10737]
MSTVIKPLTGMHAERSQVYTAHLQNSLLPELEMTRHNLMIMENDISEYENLRGKIEELEKLDGNSIETLTEMGAGIWVEAKIPDTNVITLDLGYDLHMDMNLKEAKEYVIKKVEILKRKRDNFSKKEEFLVWQIGQFHGALSQPDAR